MKTPHIQWIGNGNAIDLVFLKEADDASFPEAGQFVPYKFGHADREYILRETVGIADWYANVLAEVPCFYWDGTVCRPITCETASAICQSYVARILNEWHTEERMVSPSGRTVITFKKQHREMEEA